MGWGASASTGILVFDVVLRPFMKILMKFPIVGLVLLCLLYGTIAYKALKSAYLADQ
jgi:ABC-type transport system involved in cytochrome c biogenesis permease component